MVDTACLESKAVFIEHSAHTRILTRMVLAALLGGVPGCERENQGKGAGIRTHMLVAMGAALFVLVPQQASRAIQGIVAGIGFLGAGAIVKHRGEGYVQGLTTAAHMLPSAGVTIGDNGLVRRYRAANLAGGSEVRYIEYQFGQGERFCDLGMVTRHAHFSWEAAYKDQQMIDWMFGQVKKAGN